MGAYFGAVLPDVLDPPHSPGHRSVAHAVVPVVGVLVQANWTARCRQLQADADQYRCQGSAIGLSDLDRERCLRNEALCRFAAAALAAFIGSYLSHLALDGQTPKGLPLLA